MSQPTHRPPLPPLEPSMRALLRRVARKAATRHVLIVAPLGAGVVPVVRRLAAAWPLPEPNPLAPGQTVWTGRRWEHRPPFRAPHHTCSAAGLLGGGCPVRPGEATLAHGGILFLDDVTEFSRLACEGLREPLDTGEISIARARKVHRFPAAFRLVAHAFPCPCGFLGHPTRSCVCSANAIARHRARFEWLVRRADVCTLQVLRDPESRALGVAS